MPLGRIAHYELEERLGEGGMGVVFRGIDLRLDKPVAIKLLRPELANLPDYRERFTREGRRGAALSHPAIAACLDFGEAELVPRELLGLDAVPERALYLVMEFVPGRDLSDLVDADALSIAQVIDAGIQLADGLAAAHASGTIHRDLKPANARQMPDGRIKILDFGLARVLPADAPETATTTSFLTTEGRILGTPAYMAPEVANGARANARSDLFSLGVTFYQLVTGRLPFNGATAFEVQSAIAHSTPHPMSRYSGDVPGELERIVRKLLEKDPGRRYASAADVRNDLEALRRSRDDHRPSRGSRTRLLLAAGTLLVIGAAFAAWRLTPIYERPRTLAVVPFDNRTGEPGLDLLSGGIAQDLVSDLLYDARLDVANLSSTIAGLGASRNLVALGRSLGVQTLLTGALRREGGELIAEIRLVDTADGHVEWTRNYSFAEDQAHDLARRIVADAGPQVTGHPNAGNHTLPRAAAPASAYALYQKAATLLLDPNDPEGADRALLLFAQATDLDPDLAIAWAGRSKAQWQVWKRDRTPSALREAQESADRALLLDPTLLEARVARAQIYRSTGQFARSIAELGTVLEANPHWDEALVQLAASYRDAGRLDSAETMFRRAVAARPGYWRNWDSLGGLLAQRGDVTGAIEAFRHVITLAPMNNRGYEQVAAMQLEQADFSSAIITYGRLPGSVADGTLASNMGSAFFYARALPDAGRYDRLAVALEPRNPTWRENLGDYFVRAAQPESAHVEYQRAADLLEESLHINPESVSLRLAWAACLAKAGDCAAAQSAYARISARIPQDDADAAHLVAKLEVRCGNRARALDAVRRAARLGISPRLLRAEDEFESLVSDPAFPSPPPPR